MRRIILIIIIVALLWWQWPAITDWSNNVANKTLEVFGLGLALIDVLLLALLIVVWRWKPSSLARRWNRGLGAIAFALAIWGIMAFLGVGGNIGRSLVAYPANEITGFLRALRLIPSLLCVVGYILAGIILVAPRPSLHVVARFISWVGGWLGERTKKKPVARRTRREPQAPAPVRTAEEIASILEKPVPAVPEPEAEVAKSPAPAPESAAVPARQGLRQVAQEVWKKYGQSNKPVMVDGWQLPPLEILDRTPEVEFSQADNVKRARLIEEALASYGVEGKVVQINAGPTVTQFGVEPGWDRKTKEIKEKDESGNITVRQEEVARTRVKVERIVALGNDLALALAAPTIRIEAPVPGKPIVGIEVPNSVSSLVSLRGVIETSTFQKLAAKSKMCIALGKGAGGEAIAADLPKMPHLLIAGATGSGKTVCLNTIICCLLLHNTPYDVQFVMVDPKRVELTPFNSIPHLAAPVIVDTVKALEALRWLNQEMDKRYQKLAATGVRNIEGYNKEKKGAEKLPYLVLVIDELADLMMTGFDEVEHILCRLAQLARAIGIHLVVATQRPSVDVVTGLIKANFPTRISFAVTSQVDSRTILDTGGAEKLLGRGDMLYMPTEAAKPKRLQGCYVSDAETERLVFFWGSQKREEPGHLETEGLVLSATGPKKTSDIPEDPLMAMARELAKQHKHISVSYLQRKMRIGYPRAARLMEQLEEELGIKAEEDDEGGEE